MLEQWRREPLMDLRIERGSGEAEGEQQAKLPRQRAAWAQCEQGKRAESGGDADPQIRREGRNGERSE
jgi:hypothetical protein